MTAPGSRWLTPYGTTFADNVSYQNHVFYSDDTAATLTYYSRFGDNLDGTDPLFVDAGAGRLQPAARLAGLGALPGFKAVPFDAIRSIRAADRPRSRRKDQSARLPCAGGRPRVTMALMDAYTQDPVSRHKCLIYDGQPSEQLPVVIPLLVEGLKDN